MEESEKITIKDWISFLTYTLVILLVGICIGFSVGRNHPSADAKDEWLADIRSEVNLLEQVQKEQAEEYQLGIELRDSIISVMKRELIKGHNPETPLKININLTDHDSE